MLVEIISFVESINQVSSLLIDVAVLTALIGCVDICMGCKDRTFSQNYEINSLAMAHHGAQVKVCCAHAGREQANTHELELYSVKMVAGGRFDLFG